MGRGNGGLDLCDEYGIYFVDEANVESHELWEKKIYIGDDPAWTGAFASRGVAMVERDKNHPSVVLWSLGNETGLGRNLDAMYTAMKAIDPTRPIHYESRNPPYVHALSSFDVISTMYPTIDAILDLMNQDPTRPVIICEYAHAMGNGLGNFKKYWDVYDAHPRLQGAFVWDWVDQALRHPGPGGRTLWNWVSTRDGANANDGLVNADRTPQPELHEARKVQQPVKIEAVDLGAGHIRVRNGYDFLSLGHLALDRRVLENGEAVQSSALAEPLNVPAGESRELRLPIGSGPAPAGAERLLEVRLKLREDQPWAPRGHEVAWEQLAFPGRVTAPPTPAPVASTPALLVAESTARIEVSGPDFSATIDAGGGGLLSYRWKGEERLARVLRPHLWRVPTDNDEGGGPQSFAHRWRQAGLDRLALQPKALRAERLDSGRARVTLESRLSGTAAAMIDFTAHDYTDGALLAAKTSQEILRDGRVTLSLDLAQMGLGGDDSWSPRVHPEYQLTASEYRFAFRLRGLDRSR